MRPTRRFSQAISGGDGISLLVEIDGPEAARAAEADGARGLVVRGDLAGLRQATELPILWCAPGAADAASDADADAFLLVFDRSSDEELARTLEEAAALGLDSVVNVRTTEELTTALERADPEILMLSARERGGDMLEHLLDLLPDVPAGKLAIADAAGADAEEVAELERAGFDAVIVAAQDLAALGRDRAGTA